MKKEESKNKYLITFKKPYNFEGTEYKEIDISKLESLNTSTLIETDKIYFSGGNTSPVGDMTIAYACILAAKITQKPIEFFNQLPAKEGTKLKNMVVDFLYN